MDTATAQLLKEFRNLLYSFDTHRWRPPFSIQDVEQFNPQTDLPFANCRAESEKWGSLNEAEDYVAVWFPCGLKSINIMLLLCVLVLGMHYEDVCSAFQKNAEWLATQKFIPTFHQHFEWFFSDIRKFLIQWDKYKESHRISLKSM